MHLKIRSLSRTLLIAGTVAGMALAATPSRAQNEPPATVRLTHLVGNVSIQPNGIDSWGQAEPNMPVGPGDRVTTDQSGLGEFQSSEARAYFGLNADITLINVNNQGFEYGLASGSASVYSDGFAPGQSVFISTPNGGVTLATRGGVRVDVFPDQQSTIVTNLQDHVVELNGAGGFAFSLGGQQSIQLSGTNPVYSQPLELAPWDQFRHWSGGVESHRLNSPSAQYVNVEMPGYDDLDGAGDWQPQSQYGPVWFPHVQAGWAPYHNGHWVSRPYYGWVWVADEPWGVAPFHYGRWVAVNGRWGWIPGPREGHPIWSPAQVVFAGGINVGGVGVSVWFPLGPGEAYKPWYPCSPTYINQINISNIHESPAVHVQVNYVNIVNVTNVTYVNRTSVVAMNQSDFASGRPAQTVNVKVNVNLVEHVQPAAPAAKPPAQPVILHPIAKPASVAAARPVLINHEGKQVSAAPNAKPVVVPVKAVVVPKPIPGHATAGAPSVGGKPAPAEMKPAESKPAETKPAEPKPAQTKPVEKPVPPVKPTPQEKPAAKTNAPAPKPATPAPAAKPAEKPKAPEAKPAAPAAKPEAPVAKPAVKPAETKPAPPTKDDKKKKDEKKPE